MIKPLAFISKLILTLVKLNAAVTLMTFLSHIHPFPNTSIVLVLNNSLIFFYFVRSCTQSFSEESLYFSISICYGSKFSFQKFIICIFIA